MAERAHWFIHPYIEPSKSLSHCYLPFLKNGYITPGWFNEAISANFRHDPPKSASELADRLLAGSAWGQQSETGVHILKGFYFLMRIGDIIVMRNIYRGKSEYVLGEVISDVEWHDEHSHKGKLAVEIRHSSGCAEGQGVVGRVFIVPMNPPQENMALT